MPSPVSAPTPDPFEALFDLSLAGNAFCDPVRDAAGEVVDFAIARLNPAAQRLLALPARPATTCLAQFPVARTNGGFAFLRATFETDEPGQFEPSHQGDGLGQHVRVSARRVGEQLLVSFTDWAGQLRPTGGMAGRTQPAQEPRARAEAARQHQELARLFAQAPVAMALFRGPDYVIELANEPMATVWGRPLAQLLGQPVFAVLPEVQHQGFEALFADVLAQGTPHNLYEVPVTVDREQTGQPTLGYFDLTYRPHRDAQGCTTGIITSAHEVTEQVRARRQVEQLNQELEARVQQRTQQLAAQQGLLSQILGQVPAAIATLSGPEHRFSFFNAPYQALVAGRAALDRPVAEVLTEVEEQGFIALLDQVYITGQPFIGTETPIMLQSQAAGPAKQQYLDFTYQPLLDSQQQAQGILAFVVDVTEKVRTRKQADALQAAMLAVVERQGQERENAYQLFTQAPAAICLLREPDHRIDYLNPAYQALFPGQELLGRTQAVVQADASELGQLLDDVYQSGVAQSRQGVPVLIPPAAGQPAQTRYFDFTYQAYREDGRIAGVSIFGFDVTAQVLARQQVAVLNEELRVTNDQLTRTNADLDTFVYTASHDLKAPIANIEGLLTALRGDLPAGVLQGPLVPHLLGLMDGAVARFQQTIAHLTTVAQLQQPETAETVDLAALVAAVRLDLAPLVEAAQATLTVQLDACDTVRVAPKTARSVVYNLLSNAVKYRAPDRPAQVQLRAHCTATHVVLAVQDNGLGLSEEQQAQLFNMFRRLHTHVEGSGVGLFMVKRLIENAGGTIAVQSQPGVGSTFTVALPAAG
ncbi:MAG: PAS domain-containing sensor histidine kinase [Janthinobacterium lividum]